MEAYTKWNKQAAQKNCKIFQNYLGAVIETNDEYIEYISSSIF